MEGSFIKENVVLTRAEMDRILRSYRKMNEALRSSDTFLRAEKPDLDEAALEAEMYSLRALVLSISDPSERMLLYHYYIKGQTLEMCGKILGISDRSVYRLKSRALDNLLLKTNNKN
ncbi:MAG: sigma-70 family RNA polymerase sigma factor [Clostridia bacterium]|nr:sigma-70 family RNA polymerase sigma factor [Clostridia bacterium]